MTRFIILSTFVKGAKITANCIILLGSWDSKIFNPVSRDCKNGSRIGITICDAHINHFSNTVIEIPGFFSEKFTNLISNSKQCSSNTVSKGISLFRWERAEVNMAVEFPLLDSEHYSVSMSDFQMCSSGKQKSDFQTTKQRELEIWLSALELLCHLMVWHSEL